VSEVVREWKEIEKGFSRLLMPGQLADRHRREPLLFHQDRQ